MTRTARSEPSWVERLFRLSLWLYPISFRRAHGEEMTRMFRDLERAARRAAWCRRSMPSPTIWRRP